MSFCWSFAPRWMRWALVVLVHILLSWASAQAAQPAPVVVLSHQDRQVDLSLSLRYVEDPTGRLDLASVLDVWAELAAPEAPTKAYNFGFTPSAYWFHVRLFNQDAPEDRWLLESLYPIIDELTVYFVYPDGRRITRTAGDAVPFANRSRAHHNPNYDFTLAPGEQVDVYLRAKTTGAVQMQLMLWSESAFDFKDHQERFVFGLYYGLLLAMVAYNFLIFVSIRDINYLWYVLYILSYAGLQLSLNGLAFEHLWPNAPWWNNRSVAFFLSVGMFFILGFARSFLILRVNARWLDRLCVALMLCFAVLTGLALAVDGYGPVIRASTLLSSLSVVLIFLAGSLCWSRDFKQARYFMISWSAFLLGIMFYTLKTFGLLPANFLTDHAIQIGSAFEVVLLSMALADRLRIVTQENQRMQTAHTEELEARVRERTQALEEANRRLAALSATDGLTGVFNRRHFDQQLRLECNRGARRGPLSVLMVDVDHFKRLNDTYGHQVGDACLITIAGVLRTCVRREIDCVARYGGEEFAIILPHTDGDGARTVADHICRRIRGVLFETEGQRIPVTVSVGASTVDDGVQVAPALLLQSADRALYQAKSGGRDRACSEACVVEQLL